MALRVVSSSFLRRRFFDPLCTRTKYSSLFRRDYVTKSVEKKKILFLCTGNSCRSHMAEAWCRALHLNTLDAYSAGTIKKGLNPKMVQVMREVGIDVEIHQSSKTLQSVLDTGVFLDFVVTVCGHADETCPLFYEDPERKATTQVIHVPFEDPPELEKDACCEVEALNHYRRVRDEIKDFIAGMPNSIKPDMIQGRQTSAQVQKLVQQQ